MEKRQLSTEPTGACEKICKTVSENCPFRSIRRLPLLRSKIAMSENGEASPNHSGGRTTNSPSKTHFSLRKLVAPYKTHPGQVNIPIEPGPSAMMNEKEKMANPTVFDQKKNGRVIMIGTPTTQSRDRSTAKGDKTGTQAQNQAKKTATVISESEKPKTAVASGNSALPKAEEKPKKKTESKIPPSNIILIESSGQGHAIATPKAESAAKHHLPVQGFQPKNQPAASVVKAMGNQDEPINDTRVKEDKKPGNAGGHDHNHKYSAYIKHVKSQLRTDVGEETTTEKPPTRTLAKRDSFNDKISNFITRARKNIKLTHLGD